MYKLKTIVNGSEIIRCRFRIFVALLIYMVMLEEIIANMIDTTLKSFDFAYCVTVNIMTYLVINSIMELNGGKRVTTWNKRIVFLIVAIIAGVVYYYSNVDSKIIFNSMILAPVSWSWIFKPICIKLGIDYSSKRKKTE